MEVQFVRAETLTLPVAGRPSMIIARSYIVPRNQKSWVYAERMIKAAGIEKSETQANTPRYIHTVCYYANEGN